MEEPMLDRLDALLTRRVILVAALVIVAAWIVFLVEAVRSLAP
jgi:hypothetical protein